MLHCPKIYRPSHAGRIEPVSYTHLDARELDVKQLEKDLLEAQDEMKNELEGLEARWLDAVDLAVEEGISPYKRCV